MGCAFLIDLFGAVNMLPLKINSLQKDKLFWVLAALLALTLLSWLILSVLNIDRRLIGVLLILLAFVKVRLIVIHYMEAAKAYLPIRLAFEAWVLVAGGITIALYLQ